MENKNIIRILSELGALSSMGECRKMVLNGGVSVNGVKCTDINTIYDVEEIESIDIGKRMKFNKDDIQRWFNLDMLT